MRKTEFDNFTDHLYDVIFQETSNYVSDCIGEDAWEEELHVAHGVIMFNAVKALAKTMKITE
jgi:hypothetical protein